MGKSGNPAGKNRVLRVRSKSKNKNKKTIRSNGQKVGSSKKKRKKPSVNPTKKSSTEYKPQPAYEERRDKASTGSSLTKDQVWFSPREKAILRFARAMKKQGLNIDFELAKKMYDEWSKLFPRLRAKELPNRGTLERLEITLFDQYGQVANIESAKPEWAQRTKKRKKRQWKTLISQRTKQGVFNIMKHKTKNIFGIGYIGGTHHDFLYVNSYIHLALQQVVKTSEDRIRKRKKKK